MLLDFIIDDKGFRCINDTEVNNTTSLNYIKCHFNITAKAWQDVDAVIAIFKSVTYNKVAEVVLDSDNCCYIEPEIYRRGGAVQIKVIGDKYISDNVISTTHISDITTLWIKENLIFPTPTPSKYEVIVAELANARNAVDEAIADLYQKLSTDIGCVNLWPKTRHYDGYNFQVQSGDPITVIESEPTDILNFPDTSTATVYQAAICPERFPYSIIRNKPIIASNYIKVEPGKTTGYLIQYELYAAKTGGSRIGLTNRQVVVTGTGDWEHTTQKRVLTDESWINVVGEPDFDNCYVRVSIWKQYTEGYTAGFQVKELKLEVGSYATAWAPTVEEMANIQADWNQSDSTKNDYIKNKPTISGGSGLVINYDHMDDDTGHFIYDKTYQEVWDAMLAGNTVYLREGDVITTIAYVGYNSSQNRYEIYDASYNYADSSISKQLLADSPNGYLYMNAAV